MLSFRCEPGWKISACPFLWGNEWNAVTEVVPSQQFHWGKIQDLLCPFVQKSQNTNFEMHGIRIRVKENLLILTLVFHPFLTEVSFSFNIQVRRSCSYGWRLWIQRILQWYHSYVACQWKVHCSTEGIIWNCPRRTEVMHTGNFLEIFCNE